MRYLQLSGLPSLTQAYLAAEKHKDGGLYLVRYYDVLWDRVGLFFFIVLELCCCTLDQYIESPDSRAVLYVAPEPSSAGGGPVACQPAAVVALPYCITLMEQIARGVAVLHDEKVSQASTCKGYWKY